MKGVMTVFLYLFSTAVLAGPLFVAALAKFLVPVRRFRDACTRFLNRISNAWICCMNLSHDLINDIRLEVTGAVDLRLKEWCLVLPNHQSWVDILVMMKLFQRRIPPFKFFMKKELIWLPVLGLCFWALDFPIMKRYSRAVLEKYPHLRGKDLEITRRACEKFRRIPVAIFNFVEGTRFTEEKHRRSGSTFVHLLRPKAGGIATAKYVMAKRLRQAVDVTIAYPRYVPDFWDFVSGRVRSVRVHLEVMPVLGPMEGEDFNRFRERVKMWLNGVWERKDRMVAEMLGREAGREGAFPRRPS